MPPNLIFVLSIALLFLQLSSCSVIKRDGWYHGGGSTRSSRNGHHHHSHGVFADDAAGATGPASAKSSPFSSVTTAASADYPTQPADSTTLLPSTLISLPSFTTASSINVPVTVRSTATVQPLPVTTVANPTPISSSVQAPSPPAGEHWKPAAGATWQIELSGSVADTSLAVDVFDLDLFDTPASTISTLRSNGKKVICYFSAGSFENWRPDADSFQAADKGSAMQGWAGEWWLNTNSANVRSIMKTRIELAASKGCDGVDPDNVDGYNNANGLGLTAADATSFLGFLADTAHSLGLSIGLKNAGDLVTSVLEIMEWHVNEQCLEYNECQLFQPFIDAGKPVFHIEYPSDAPAVSSDVKAATCGAASASGFSTVLKTLDLSAWVEPC